MSTIVYTALRNMERTGFRVASDDISVLGSGGSPLESPAVNRFVINSSPANSLAGLLDGQWVYATGFDADDNNGSFEVEGDSSTSIINVAQNLFDEVSGAPVVLEGHVRGIGQEYTLEFNVEQLDDGDDFTSKHHVPIGGGRGETLLHRRERYIDLTTHFLLQDEIPQWREFFASVAARETFTLDCYGTIATPDEPLTVQLDSQQFRQVREGKLRKYHYAFRVKVIE